MQVPTSMPGWMRGLFVILGIITVIFGFICMFRPMVTVEFILVLVPLALLVNGISWIVLGAAGGKKA